MPAAFQKTLNKTLENIDNKFNFLDDILIITKGTPDDHDLEINRVLSRLDKENLAIRKVRIRKTNNNLAWLQNYPIGIFTNLEKKRQIRYST